MKKVPPLKGQTIWIPHLDYKVVVKDIDTLGAKRVGIWCTERTSNSCSTLYIKNPTKPHEYGMLAHEVTHVLQNLYDDFRLEFLYERENTAYLMQYVMNCITSK